MLAEFSDIVKNQEGGAAASLSHWLLCFLYDFTIITGCGEYQVSLDDPTLKDPNIPVVVFSDSDWFDRVLT